MSTRVTVMTVEIDKYIYIFIYIYALQQGVPSENTEKHSDAKNTRQAFMGIDISPNTAEHCM